jgi:hypothetical protein
MTEPTLFELGPAPGPARRAPVLAAVECRDNAEMVLALRDLGYLTGRVLDPTYGAGRWWQHWQPAELECSDLADGVDVRALPWPDASFDAAVFDPPHLPSSRPSSTADVWTDRFGLDDGPMSNAELDELYRAGILELARVIRPGGHLIVKATPHVNGRRYHPMSVRVAMWCEAAGLRVVDELVMVRPPGPLNLATNGTQQTSRRNYSTATVARRPSSGRTRWIGHLEDPPGVPLEIRDGLL